MERRSLRSRCPRAACRCPTPGGRSERRQPTRRSRSPPLSSSPTLSGSVRIRSSSNSSSNSRASRRPRSRPRRRRRRSGARSASRQREKEAAEEDEAADDEDSPTHRRRLDRGRNPDGSPNAQQPHLLRRAPGPVAGEGRAELRHPQVPGADLPPAHLPGRRHPVRRALGDPRGHQRDRDRLRPQPQRLLRGRPRLDAVHARHLAQLRRRREQGRREGPLQPGRRDLRRRPLPQGRRRRARTSSARSSPTTTPTGTWTRCCCAPG